MAHVSSNDVQRLFLQAILSRGILSYAHAQALREKCVASVLAADDSLDIEYQDGRPAWEAFVTNINQALDCLDLDFRQLSDEQTGREMYGLVNRKGDEIAQMATDYTPAEITFFKAIVEQIMLSPRHAYSISSLAALREVSHFKSNMTKTQAEIVLGSFVARGWLVKSARGRYSLSTRTLLELGPYLKSTYPDEHLECNICFEMITRGVACYTPNCQTRIHYHCFQRHRRRSSKCPSCSADWPQEQGKPLLAVGEDAVKEGQEEGRQVRRRDTEEADSGDDEQLEEPTYMEDDEQTPSQSQGTQRRPGGGSMSMDGAEEEAGPSTQTQRRASRRSGRR